MELTVSLKYFFMNINEHKKKLFHSVSSLTVGWRGPLSRHGGAPQRSSDAVAPHHRQALPHPAV